MKLWSRYHSGVPRKNFTKLTIFFTVKLSKRFKGFKKGLREFKVGSKSVQRWFKEYPKSMILVSSEV